MQNILLLEDDTFISLNIKQCIEAQCNAQVHRSYNTSTALKISREITIDLLIADINLNEDMDGIDVAIQLGELYSTPTLFLTSYGDENTLKKAAQVNSIGYILKPFREDDLIAKLRLEQYRHIKEPVQLTNLNKTYTYNHEAKELLKDNTPVILTTKEQLLFHILFNASGKMVPFSYIDDVLWAGKTVSANTRRQLFYRLCKKLPELEFENISHIGYVLHY